MRRLCQYTGSSLFPQSVDSVPLREALASQILQIVQKDGPSRRACIVAVSDVSKRHFDRLSVRTCMFGASVEWQFWKLEK